MQINCLIVDDEPPAQRIIENYLKDFEHVKVVAKCKNAFEAINALQSQKIDLMFLDINMPRMNGMELLNSLRNPPLVIITTAYREYAAESYEFDVVDYLNKPFSFERFFKAFQKVQERLTMQKPIANELQEISSKDDFLFIKSDKKLIRLKTEDILYIESLGDYLKINTKNGKIVSHITLKKIQELLPEKQFFRIHKSYVISLSKIDFVEGNSVVIENDRLPVGSSYRKTFFEIIQQNNN